MAIIMVTGIMLTACGSIQEWRSDTMDEATNVYWMEELSVQEFKQLMEEHPIHIIPSGNGFREDSATGIRRFVDSQIFNNTDEELHIRRLELAFVTWDRTSAPLAGHTGTVADMIRGRSGGLGGLHINQAVFTSQARIRIPARESFEFSRSIVTREFSGAGFGLVRNVDDNDIFYSMSIVVSYRDSHGNEWRNPYFDAFMEAFDGNNFNENITISVRRS